MLFESDQVDSYNRVALESPSKINYRFTLDCYKHSTTLPDENTFLSNDARTGAQRYIAEIR